MIYSIQRGLVMLFLAAMLCACASPKPTQSAATPEVQISTHVEQFSLPATTRLIEIRNRHGDVRVRFGDRQTVGLHATVQRIDPGSGDAEFRVSNEDGRWQLDVRFRGDETWASDHTRARVDFGIWLPRDLPIDVQTTDGTVQVKRAKSALRIRSTSGAVQASGQSELDIETDSGAIIARQESGEWQVQARVVSRTGRVLMAVPAFADVQLRAETGGVLSVDAGLPTPQPMAGGGMRLHADFGAASHALELRTAGDMHLVPVIKVAAGAH